MRICAQKRKRNKSFLCPFSVSFHVVDAGVGERKGGVTEKGGGDRKRKGEQQQEWWDDITFRTLSVSVCVCVQRNKHTWAGATFSQRETERFSWSTYFFCKVAQERGGKKQINYLMFSQS